jgi:hypothetical protein
MDPRDKRELLAGLLGKVMESNKTKKPKTLAQKRNEEILFQLSNIHYEGIAERRRQGDRSYWGLTDSSE